jgi:hypothetical protein
MSSPLKRKATRDARDFAELGVEPLHDRARRLAGSHDSVPERNFDARVAQFGEGGDVRKQRMALRARRRQHPQLAGGDERQQRRHRVEHDRHAAGDQIDHRRTAAAIGHVQEVGPGRGFEQLAGEMRGAAVAGGGEGELARPRLGERESRRQPSAPADPR